MMDFKYKMSTEVYFGKEVIKKNQEVFKKAGEKALIVTGKHSAKINGSFDDVSSALLAMNIDYVLFDQVEENPSLETIEIGGDLGKKNQVDFVIGIGGGSPMDAAKAIAIFIKNPDINQHNIFCGRKLESIPVIEVATTAGTGSEVTPYSIVTSNVDKTKKNLGQMVYPLVAFLDSRYTFALSEEITINTAVDAFTHLVEGYLNTNSTKMSEVYGERGFSIFASCFQGLLQKKFDESFREEVLLASMLAGIQIAQTGTSLPHGMGYALTYFKGVPHGLANGVLTIEYLKSFRDKTKINKMLELLELKELEELEGIFRQLVQLKVDITRDEILEYSKSIISNQGKLKNHTESVELEDIVRIYEKSLL